MSEADSVFRKSIQLSVFEIDCSSWCPEAPPEASDSNYFVPGKFYGPADLSAADSEWAAAELEWEHANQKAKVRVTLWLSDRGKLAQLKTLFDDLKGKGVAVSDVEIV